MRIPDLIAVDPGSEKSALVEFNCGFIGQFFYLENDKIKDILSQFSDIESGPFPHLAIETLHPRGEMASIDAFRTQLWAGRFIEAFGQEWSDMDNNRWTREITKGFVAGDKTIRRALIDRYGGDRSVSNGGKCPMCKGRKMVGRGKARQQCAGCQGGGLEHEPGPLCGITGDDLWSAIGIGVAWYQQRGIVLPLQEIS